MFNGQLSDDGATVTDFTLRSFFGSPSNFDHAFALQFSLANQSFTATDTPYLAKGSFAATVADASPADVPEPSSFALFGLAALALVFAARRQRRGKYSSLALSAA